MGGVAVRHRLARLKPGMSLHFVDAGPESAPLALLLHGFPDCHLSWAAQLPALLAAGMRIVAPDLRGYGRSSAPAGVSAYGAAKVVEDLVGLLDLLGCASAALVVGHDWGGAAAWHLAARCPKRVRRLAILNCPHPRVFAATLASSGAQVCASWCVRPCSAAVSAYPGACSWVPGCFRASPAQNRETALRRYIFVFQLPWLPERLLAAGDFAALRAALATETVQPAPVAMEKAYVTEFRRSGFRGPLNFYRALARGLWRMPPAPAPVACPVLVLWGDGDAHLTPQLAQPPSDDVPRARVVRFGSAKHWVHWDLPLEVNAALVAFLQES